MTATHSHDPKDVETLAKLIHNIKIAMLTTVVDERMLRSRPMATQQAPFDGALWFFAQADTGLVKEISADDRVNVSYADPSDNRYVSVSGHAAVTRNREKAEALWTELHRAWFPKGLDDPNLALLRIDVTDAEYWDAPSSKMVQLAGFVKAMITGKPATGIGENRKIHL
jgi:general stress protein 26